MIQNSRPNEIMNEQGLYDIYGHWHVPFWQTQFFRISIYLLIGIIIAGAIYLLIRKRSKKQLSISQKALESLKILKNKPITTRKDAHGAYFTLTDILKNFFAVYYSIPCKGMTDLEVIASLQKMKIPDEYISHVDQIMQAGLGVKYAQEAALQNDVTRDISKATTLITSITTHDSKVK